MKFDKKEKLDKYIEEDVIVFLKKHNAYDKFIFNLKKWINNKNTEAICFTPISINSFHWAPTEEKHDYWSRLDCKYNYTNPIRAIPRKAIRFRELKDLIK